MCTSPLTITNQCEQRHPLHKLYYEVPCQHCQECRNQKVINYLVRNYVAFKDCEDAGGKGLFVTLTYDPEHVPTINTVMCFSSEHIKNFNKRLRRRIAYHFGIMEDAFKFWLVCEYGGLYGRPHYHILYYLCPELSSKENIIAFCDQVRNAWMYGNCDVCSWDVESIEDGHKQYYLSMENISKHTLNSSAAIKYITKYLDKYDDDKQYLKDSLAKQGILPEQVVTDSGRVYDRYIIDGVDVTYKITPFIRQSINLGYNDKIDLLACATVNIPQGNGDLTPYDYPLYYHRKQFYKKREVLDLDTGEVSPMKTDRGNYMYEISSRGRQYRLQNLDKMILDKALKYQSYLECNVKNHLALESIKDSIQKLHITPDQLAIYNICLRHQLVDFRLLSQHIAEFGLWAGIKHYFIFRWSDDTDIFHSDIVEMSWYHPKAHHAWSLCSYSPVLEYCEQFFSSYLPDVRGNFNVIRNKRLKDDFNSRQHLLELKRRGYINQY